jgi:hypothetical protein
MEVDGNDTMRGLADAEAEIARLRQENWELRDAVIGSAAQERTVRFLIDENNWLRYLVRRPWRSAQIKAQHELSRARRRLVSLRSAN